MKESLIKKLCFAGGLAVVLTIAAPQAVQAATLTIVGPEDGKNIGPQSASNPCIIAGTTCQQPANFGYNNFTSDGNTSMYDMYSTTPTANVADGVEGTPYTVAQLGTLGDGTNMFWVAIDVNTTGAAGETLTLFEVINVTTNTVLYTFDTSTNIGNINNNGNGWADYTLRTVDLSGQASTDQILFHAVWSNASDGAESFFLIPLTDSGIPVVPEPASLALLGAGLAGVGAAVRRRRARR